MILNKLKLIQYEKSLLDRKKEVMQLESNNIKFRDLKSEFEYEQNKLTIREIDVISREGIVVNKEKEIEIRESNLQKELADFIKRK